MSDFIPDNKVGDAIASQFGEAPKATTAEQAQETAQAEQTTETVETAEAQEQTTEQPQTTATKTQSETVAETQEATQSEDADANALNSFLADDNQESIWDVATQTTEQTEQEQANVPQEVQQKVDAYDSLMSDHRISKFVEFIQGGGKIEDFSSTIGLRDVSKLTDEQIFKLDLEELGIKGEAAIEEIERFDEKSAYEKKRLTNEIRSKYDTRNEEALKNFSAVSPEQQAAQQQEQERQQIIIQEAQAELDNRVNSMTGKKFYNLEVTQEMSNEVKNYVTRHTMYKYDGNNPVGYDIIGSIENALWALYRKPLLRAVQDAAKVQAIDKTLNDRHRPNDNSTTTTSQRANTNDGYKDALATVAKRSQSKFKRVPLN